ncbi:MAG TPA: cytidylate kinase family protein, partial [Longimicrobiales bacterium]|nr:cytidylate kinase family protein [Longimicrobiales bacterium]
RVARMARRTGRDPAALAEEARARDEARAGYLRHHYGRDWEDPALYHLVVNAQRVPIPETVDLLSRLVELRGAPGS